MNSTWPGRSQRAYAAPPAPSCAMRSRRLCAWLLWRVLPFEHRVEVVAERLHRRVQLRRSDVRVAAHVPDIGVPKVLGDQARVAGRLTQPGGGGVAQRVCCDVLLDARTCAVRLTMSLRT